MERSQNDELSGVPATVLHGSVMIVESDAAYARVLRAYLELRGWSPIACTAREAMRDLPSLRPRALVLDFDAPDVDAFELLHVMSDVLHGTQVLVCSRYPEPQEPERSSLRELGVSHWLRRPYSMEQLAGALTEMEGVSAALGSGALAQAPFEA
jgi:DNA-binding response OmpR family regulator